MVANVPYNPMLSSYYNQNYLSTFLDDYEYGTPMGQSIFDNPFGNPYCAMPLMSSMPYMNPYMNPYMSNDYYNQMQNYYQRQNQFDLSINSPEYAIQGALSNLNEKIVTNEQNQIRDAVDNVVEALRTKYPNATEAELRRSVSHTYAQAYGQPLVQAIRENGSSSFWQGFKQVITFGIADKYTAEDNIEYITGQKQGRKTTIGKIAGRAAAGAAIGALIPGFHIAGAIIGGILGAISYKK